MIKPFRPGIPAPPRQHCGAVGALLKRAGAALIGLAAVTFMVSVGAAPTPTEVTLALKPVAAADPGSTLPEDWQHGVFMEIFVRGFKDSDGDGIGDLRGLIQKLDYLRDLGIKGLWLMPITRSQDGDHGYAVADYRAIEPSFGNLADFDELLKEAHRRGIGVIVDYVVNHSAAQHPIFLESASSPQSAFRDWFIWRDQAEAGWVNSWDPKWQPWHSTPAPGVYFGGFWREMPDWNLRNPAVVAWHHDNLRFWLNRGVDGFRFDAVGNLFENGGTSWLNQPENYPFMGDIRRLVQSYRNRYIVCEGPSFDYLGFVSPQSCGSAFAFEHNNRIIKAAKGDADAVKAVAEFFKTAPAGLATLLSNHDDFAGRRIADQLGGDAAAYRLAAATYLLMPGTPFVYYGEEIGMAGGIGLKGDAELRSPLSWTADANNAGFSSARPYRVLASNVATANVAAQKADPASLLSFYTAMLGLRNRIPALAQGSYEQAVSSGLAMSFQRRLGDEQIVVAINYGTAPASLSIASLPARAKLATLYPAKIADSAADASGMLAVELAPQSLRVMQVQR
jgi:glycosidase